LWTAVINKAKFVNIVKVQYGASLGINVTAGPGLCAYLPPVVPSVFFSSVLKSICCSPRRRPHMGSIRLLHHRRHPLRHLMLYFSSLNDDKAAPDSGSAETRQDLRSKELL
jgi:hypothetical protein